MRKNIEILKSGTKIRIAKKKKANKSNYSWYLANTSDQSLDHIKEYLRKHKNGRNDTWKLVPKDSIEVYRARRRKQQYQDSNSNFSSNMSEVTSSEEHQRSGPDIRNSNSDFSSLSEDTVSGDSQRKRRNQSRQKFQKRTKNKYGSRN